MAFETVKANLEKNGFTVSVFATKEEAAAFAAALQKLYTASKLESRAGFPHFQKASGSEADDEA